MGVAAIALVATAAIATIAWSRADGPVDPESAALRTATEGALRSLYLEDMPPSTYVGGPLASPIVAAMRARVIADMGRYFSAPMEARYQPMILDAINRIGSSEWDAQGDLAIDWSGARIDGDRATVHLSETGWVVRRGGQFGTDLAATHRLDSTWEWTVTLVRSAGEWRVDGLDSHCRQGCP